MEDNKLEAVFYDIYDEETNKTLHIKANSLEEANMSLDDEGDSEQNKSTRALASRTI